MAAISWGNAGERRFESGVDRGVLYLAGESGVPWSGLASVKENPVGGEPRPYYLDGFKYLNLASAEEFSASIEAFTAPEEFGVCDGTVSISNGLYVTQQPRLPFGFSYRTLVGNDTQGTELGYKIHLVYGALAAPTPRDNKTLNNAVELNTLSWEITTAPPLLQGYRPTAHFVIESHKIEDWRLLAEIEDRLYGNAEHDAYLPTQADVVELFSTWGL